MRQYDSYRDSGVKWIGKIPSHWDVRRLKFFADTITKGNGITKEEIFPDGDTPCVRYGEIYSKYNSSFTNCISKTRLAIHPVRRYFGYGDILFAGTGELVDEIGKNIVYLGNSLCLAGGDIIILKHQQNPSFLNYLLNSYYVQCQKSCGKAKLKVVHISASEIGNTYVALPDVSEQQAIASYLDVETTRINNIIANRERKIKLLEELRNSIISKAITYGIDKNVETKNTDIEWIGRIPKHWELRKIKYACISDKYNIKTGPFGSQLKGDDLRPEGDVRVYNQRNVIDNDYSSTSSYVSFEKANSLSSFYTRPNDILITSRGTIGRCSILPSNVPMGILHPCLIAIRINDNICLREWLQTYISESNAFSTDIKLMSNATTIDVIYTDTLKNIVVPCPPISEQRRILLYIQENCISIKKKIYKAQAEIDLLKEYCSSLITEVVTGKRKVV